MSSEVKVITVWVSYAIGIVVTGTPFVGVIMAYFCGSTNNEPGVAGHNAAQRRAFWWGFAGWVVAFVVIGLGFAMLGDASVNNADELIVGGTMIIVGLAIGVIVQIAFTIYAIVGIVRASGKTNWPGSEVIQNHTTVFG